MRTVKANGREVAIDALLTALHNNARATGLGALHDAGGNLSRADVAGFLSSRGVSDDTRLSVDYMFGRPIKIYESADGEVDGRLYDRDAGEGTFERAVDEALAMPELES